MVKCCLTAMCFATLAVCAALAQQKKTAPPPPKPADEGPSLEVTIKFIQDKLKDIAEIKWAQRPTETRGGGDPRWQTYGQPAFSEVLADPSSCQVTFHQLVHQDKATCAALSCNAQLEWTWRVSFHDVEKIEVMSRQDYINREHAKEGHPELQEVVTPAVFDVNVVMTTGKTVHELFITTAKSGEATRNDIELKNWPLTIPDEVMADRLAKAVVHAVELCGGGGKKEEEKEPF
jgi:hypothetical protein